MTYRPERIGPFVQMDPLSNVSTFSNALLPAYTGFDQLRPHIPSLPLARKNTLNFTTGGSATLEQAKVFTFAVPIDCDFDLAKSFQMSISGSALFSGGTNILSPFAFIARPNSKILTSTETSQANVCYVYVLLPSNITSAKGSATISVDTSIIVDNIAKQDHPLLIGFGVTNQDGASLIRIASTISAELYESDTDVYDPTRI